MTDEPNPKPPLPEDPLWREAIEKEMTAVNEEAGFRLPAFIRGLWRMIFSPRRHKRREIDFTNPARVRLRAEGFDREVAPTDFGVGGMGLQLPRPYLIQFQIGQRIRLSITFDQTTWHETEAEVRFLLAQGAAQGSLGVQFHNPPKALVDEIDERIRRS